MRLAALIEGRGGRWEVFTSTYRFVTGLGRGHPVENGFPCNAGHDQDDQCGRRDGSFRHRPSRWARQDRDGGSTRERNSPPVSQRTSQSPTSARRAGLTIGANMVARRTAVDAPKRAAAIRHSNARCCSTPCSRPCLRPCAKPCSRPSRSHCLGHSPTRSTNVIFASSNVRAGGTAAPAGARRSAICRTQSANARCNPTAVRPRSQPCNASTTLTRSRGTPCRPRRFSRCGGIGRRSGTSR